jgi:predicted nucleotidyltransferase
VRPEVLDAYLFGSQARGDAGPLSDVDVAVYVEPAALGRPGFGIQAELGSDLQAALGRSDVDVVVLNQAPPLLYHRVLRDGVRLLSRSEPETATREGQALSRYCDFVPQLRKIEAAHQARIAAGKFGT